MSKCLYLVYCVAIINVKYVHSRENTKLLHFKIYIYNYYLQNSVIPPLRRGLTLPSDQSSHHSVSSCSDGSRCSYLLRSKNSCDLDTCKVGSLCDSVDAHGVYSSGHMCSYIPHEYKRKVSPSCASSGESLVPPPFQLGRCILRRYTRTVSPPHGSPCVSSWYSLHDNYSCIPRNHTCVSWVGSD